MNKRQRKKARRGLVQLPSRRGFNHFRVLTPENLSEFMRRMVLVVDEQTGIPPTIFAPRCRMTQDALNALRNGDLNATRP